MSMDQTEVKTYPSGTTDNTPKESLVWFSRYHKSQSELSSLRLEVQRLKKALEYMAKQGLGLCESGCVYHVLIANRSIVTIHCGSTALGAIESAMEKKDLGE